MEIAKTPKAIFAEIDRDSEYKMQLNLYENVKRNNNFYHDKQWEGLNVSNIDTPIVNVIKPSVKYFISQLVADDISVSVDLPEKYGDAAEEIEKILHESVMDILENNRFGWIDRNLLRQAAIDGDAGLYISWDSEKDTGSIAKGDIKLELIDNTNVVFADTSSEEVQSQPYLILIKRMPTKVLRAQAEKDGVSEWESIKDDGAADTNSYNGEKHGEGFTDLAIKFWKEDGVVWWTSVTRTVVCREPTSLNVSLYPLVWFSWEHDKHSYHGISPVTGLIPNQVMINKNYAMMHACLKNIAYTRIFYDATKLQQGISNKPGVAIAVNGNPNDAIMSGYTAPPMNSQIFQYTEDLLTKTKDSFGVYDAALGNVKPDNTSAIIAVQQASSQPLVLQKLDHYQCIEDMVRICFDFMHGFYGLREVGYVQEIQDELTGITQEIKKNALYDFGTLDTVNMSLNVDVGAGSYWNELVQVQTIDNLMTQGIIPDPVTYLEQIPDNYIKNKQKIIDKIQAKQAQAAQQIQPQGLDIPIQA